MEEFLREPLEETPKGAPSGNIETPQRISGGTFSGTAGKVPKEFLKELVKEFPEEFVEKLSE